MSIEKMALANIVGDLEDLDTALGLCCKSECFHIELALHTTANTGFMLLNETNPYAAPLKKLTDLAAGLSVPLSYTDVSGSDIPNSQLGDRVDALETEVHLLLEEQSACQKQIYEYEQAIQQIEHLKGSPVDFDTLFSSKHVKTRFGRLPVDSYKKLSYYNNKTFFFFDFDHNDDYYWGFYIAPKIKISVIDDIFAALFFERIWVPDYAHGTPDIAIADIRKSLQETQEKLDACRAALDAFSKENREMLQILYCRLKALDDTFDMRKYVAVYKGQFYLNGFIPKQKSQAFEALFAGCGSIRCILKPQDADPSLKPPVKLRNGWFARPFENFVEMYGLPSYTDIDPTPLVAVTYTLLFGLMFGDLGQGLVIALLGLVLSKWKKMNFGKILTRIGISSAVFGTVYGSVFGYEHLLDPLYQKLFGLPGKPIEVMESTNMLLIGTVGIGVVLIILTIGINIVLGIKHKEFERAFFGANGLAGLVLYVSIVLAVVLMVSNINVLNPVFIILCIVLPLVLMFLRQPLSKLCKKRKDIKPEDGIGGFITENFFELFEFLLSYITNTMSFLRVGGFILSHAGMMSVVMTLSHGVGTVGSPVVMVFGNLLVMCLEGLIVGIQVLRLEFYEIFSRFFEGSGKPFVASKISYAPEEQK